jgi:SAM-dependent methyltransferase
MTAPDDRWTAGDSYEEFMGRWSRPLAREFVAWLKLPVGGDWLDVGTGTGALATAVCSAANPASVTGCDPSAAFIETARRGLVDRRARLMVAGAGALPPREGGYDAVVSALALNFFPDPLAAIQEQFQLVKPGGTVAAVVWDYAGGMEFLRHFWDAATAVHPNAAELDEGVRFPICNPDALRTLFTDAGADDVRVGAVTIPTLFPNFADYWRPFTAGTGPAPSLVASLSPRGQRELEDELRHRLGAVDEGPLALQASAWAVAGR